jgi:hypothetical protein
MNAGLQIAFANGPTPFGPREEGWPRIVSLFPIALAMAREGSRGFNPRDGRVLGRRVAERRLRARGLSDFRGWRPQASLRDAGQFRRAYTVG